MQSKNYAYVNGRFVPEAEATVSIFDRGFLYGDGVFETMRVYGGKIFRLAEHTTRLGDGMEQMSISSPISRENLRLVCDELLKRNHVAQGVVRIYVTRGVADIGLSTAQGPPVASIVIVAQAREFDSKPKELRVIKSAWRIDCVSPLSRLKTANRLPYVLARREAELAGVHDAILFNTAGAAAEFTASNLFVVRNAQILTPPTLDGALPGITRDAVLTLASASKIDTCEASLRQDDLMNADEVFATNSLIEIAPVIELSGKKLSFGPITRALLEAYQAFVREDLDLQTG